MLKKEIFRKYDIRGIFGEYFDAKGANLIGKAFGTYLLRNSKHKNIKVVLAKDGRNSSDEIEQEFQNGLQLTGVEITNIGFCASPVFLYALCKGKFDGGCIITASHNPGEYNGFKLELKNSKSLFGDELQKIYEIIEKGYFEICKKNNLKKIEVEAFFPTYLRKIREIETKGIEDFNFTKNNRPKVVIDGGNGVGGVYAVNIFRFLGYEVEELFCEIDGNFPNHPADPEEEENLEDLKKKVIELKADIGLAFDGDGDRIGIVDSEGNSYSAEQIMLPLLEDFLEKSENKSVVCDLKVGGIIKEFVEKKGGKYFETAVGHPFLKEKMKNENILFGAESSGHFYLAEKYFVIDDAFLAGALFLKKFFKTEKRQKISEYFKNFEEKNGLKKYFKFTKKFEIDEEKKFKKIEEIGKILEKKFEISKLDGIKIQYDDFTKIIIRASNTSPKIQFEVESDNEGKIEEIKGEFLELF
ncbi:phosphomannomutase/phosphoglucomutase [Candidatus Gracilibacteria bacterium]|nr:phosphomannomutase/phosphoglucomutase [Candidatus Gracilibacteria bacterium]